MDSIEILEIRLSNQQNKLLENEIGRVIKEVIENEAEYTLRFYSKSQLRSDYLIIIFHSQKLTNHKKSELGQHLKEALKDFGMINHSVWNELS